MPQNSLDSVVTCLRCGRIIIDDFVTNSPKFSADNENQSVFGESFVISF